MQSAMDTGAGWWRKADRLDCGTVLHCSRSGWEASAPRLMRGTTLDYPGKDADNSAPCSNAVTPRGLGVGNFPRITPRWLLRGAGQREQRGEIPSHPVELGNFGKRRSHTFKRSVPYLAETATVDGLKLRESGDAGLSTYEKSARNAVTAYQERVFAQRGP